MEKIYCSKCQRYTEPEYYGIHLLYEGCEKCGKEYKLQPKKEDARYHFETYLQEWPWIIRPVIRIYNFFIYGKITDENVYGKRKGNTRPI